MEARQDVTPTAIFLFQRVHSTANKSTKAYAHNRSSPATPAPRRNPGRLGRAVLPCNQGHAPPGLFLCPASVLLPTCAVPEGTRQRPTCPARLGSMSVSYRVVRWGTGIGLCRSTSRRLWSRCMPNEFKEEAGQMKVGALGGPVHRITSTRSATPAKHTHTHNEHISQGNRAFTV